VYEIYLGQAAERDFLDIDEKLIDEKKEI